MLRGLYSATAGMIAQQRKHDAATNNISNLNTPGFKQTNVVQRSFPEMLISLVRGGEGEQVKTIGRLHGGAFAEESLSSFIQGDVTSTGNPTDLALVTDIQVPGINFDASGRGVNEQGEVVYQPQAFFTVVNGQGEERYTRDGKFSVNETGEWVTSTGYRLIGTDGEPITLGNQQGDIQVASNGGLIDNVTGEPVIGVDGQPLSLRISVIDNPYDLIREGDGNFRLGEDADPARLMLGDEGAQVMQGYVERSNVDATAATVDMMSALRAYEANQKVIQFYDRSIDKAVNEVGRV
jgi:flagellar basal-body rod protein FlgF